MSSSLPEPDSTRDRGHVKILHLSREAFSTAKITMIKRAYTSTRGSPPSSDFDKQRGEEKSEPEEGPHFRTVMGGLGTMGARNRDICKMIFARGAEMEIPTAHPAR